MAEEKKSPEAAPSNPLIEFMGKPPLERLRLIEGLLENPAWQALDTVLSMDAIKANTTMLNAETEFEMIRAGGSMKRILEIRQWPGQVIASARGQIEMEKAQAEKGKR